MSYDIEIRNDVTNEEQIIKDIIIEKLHKILLKLSLEESHLIMSLFFEQKPERILAKELQVTQSAIHARKVNLLIKLKKMLNS